MSHITGEHLIEVQAEGAVVYLRLRLDGEILGSPAKLTLLLSPEDAATLARTLLDKSSLAYKQREVAQ